MTNNKLFNNYGKLVQHYSIAQTSFSTIQGVLKPGG